jgi:hypothetical protein
MARRLFEMVNHATYNTHDSDMGLITHHGRKNEKILSLTIKVI